MNDCKAISRYVLYRYTKDIAPRTEYCTQNCPLFNKCAQYFSNETELHDFYIQFSSVQCKSLRYNANDTQNKQNNQFIGFRKQCQSSYPSQIRTQTEKTSKNAAVQYRNYAKVVRKEKNAINNICKQCFEIRVCVQNHETKKVLLKPFGYCRKNAYL